MKVFAISLKRATQRYNYIQSHLNELGLDYKMIDAVDGNLFTQEDLGKYADVEEVKKYPHWLTRTAIGCSLSHLEAYKAFLATNESHALILEDDALLPPNIKKILSEVKKNITQNSLTLLYYTSFPNIDAKLSTVGKIALESTSLYSPMNIDHVLTATAYVITREFAEGMCENVIPIKVAADKWEYFYNKKSFDVKVLYPAPVKTKNFKSSIEYNKSTLAKFSSFIDKYKIPILYQILALRRKKLLDTMLDNFTFTDDASPYSN